VKDSVRLAIAGPADTGARVHAVLADLMASSGVLVARTGSVVLDWPNARLPYDPHAWTSERSAEADPVAYASRLLLGDADGWEAPVDAVRARVGAWLRDERLRLSSPWPDGATCAIALVHDVLPTPVGLRGRLARRRGTGLEPYERVAELERACGATSALLGADVLAPDEQTQVAALGFALDTPAALCLADRPGFRRGTAFPTRAGDAVELPLVDGAGIRALLDAGGGAVLRVPLDDPGYADKLERLRAVGAWLTTPLALARALYA
jgi:hypothetical protein